MRIAFYKGPGLAANYSEDLSPCPEEFTMHAHFQAELFYFISGDAVYHVEGSEYALQPGDILLMRPAEAHYIELRSNAPYRRIVISFNPELFTPLDPEGHLMRPYHNRESGQHNLYRKSDFKDCDSGSFFRLLYEHTGSRHGSIAAVMLLMSAINRIFDAAPPAHAQSDTIEYQMMRYINAHLGKNISLEKMAQFFYISRAQLCRRFKRATGTSVGSYVNAKRMITARAMLLEGKKPTEVYAACGYTDYSTFYRAYCKYFGYTPKKEISAHGQEDP